MYAGVLIYFCVYIMCAHDFLVCTIWVPDFWVYEPVSFWLCVVWIYQYDL